MEMSLCLLFYIRPSESETAATQEKKRESVDQTSLDKKAGLNKFRDLEKLREEQRRQHEEEQEAEKKRKGAYSGEHLPSLLAFCQ